MKVWPKKFLSTQTGPVEEIPAPVPWGFGFLTEDHQLIYEEARYLEAKNTNNFAEYKAVIRA